MSTELKALVAGVPEAMKAEREARKPVDPAGAAWQKVLVAKLQTLVANEFPVVTPLVSDGIDFTLRQEVLNAFERVDAEVGASLLIGEAEQMRPSPGLGLSTGVDALTFTLMNFGTYGGGLVRLKAAFAKERVRLRAIAAGMEGYDRERLDQGIGALGLTPEDIAGIKAELAAGNPQGVRRLTKVLMPLDPGLGEVVAELQQCTRRMAPSGSRDYGQAVYVLSKVASKFEVDVGVFVQVMSLFPNSNESEMALTGIKRSASRCASSGDRDGFERIVRGISAIKAVPALEQHFAGLKWA